MPLTRCQYESVTRQFTRTHGPPQARKSVAVTAETRKVSRRTRTADMPTRPRRASGRCARGDQCRDSHGAGPASRGWSRYAASRGWSRYAASRGPGPLVDTRGSDRGWRKFGHSLNLRAGVRWIIRTPDLTRSQLALSVRNADSTGPTESIYHAALDSNQQPSVP